MLVLAKLAGMQSLLGASEWIADQASLLREGLHLAWKRMPCANTYSYALERLDRKPRECSPGLGPRLLRSPAVHQAILYALYTAYVILLKNMMDMRECISPKPVTENTLFYGDNLMSRYGYYEGK